MQKILKWSFSPPVLTWLRVKHQASRSSTVHFCQGWTDPKLYCCRWAWSTQRCPARTQCPSWWEGSDPPHRSASGRRHIWSTRGGKPCPARASSSRRPGSSSHKKHRGHPDQKAWGGQTELTCVKLNWGSQLTKHSTYPSRSTTF